MIVLSSVSAGLWLAVAVAESLASVSVPPAGVPVAEALFVTEPASRSAWLTVWPAVQVATASGASVVTSQTGVASTLSSLTATPLIVTLPVLVTTYW